jgi:superfamily II DNA helicase RecQ
LTRLSIWFRDEIVRNSSCSEEAENITSSLPIDNEDESSGNCLDDDDEDASTSSLELEITLPSNVQSSVKRPNASEANDRVSVEFDADIDESDTCNESIVEPTKALHSSLMKRCLKEYFGYNSFRDGQEWAILRCLNHQRSLLVAPTGFGKSLCYALPAALMDGVCIVVSPLISLIEVSVFHVQILVNAMN